jgi:galactonate dehydratase
MNRRLFLKSMAAAYGFAHLPLMQAALPKMKITRVRAYAPPSPNPLFNQADTVVTIETDAGITGVGEGGFPDTLKQCAGRLIGQDPQHIERLWQDMSRSFFYPPGPRKGRCAGRARSGALGLKGKVLKLPVHEILGGMVRNYCECYNTGGIVPGIKPGMSI